MNNKQQQWPERRQALVRRHWCFHSHLHRTGSRQSLPALMKKIISSPHCAGSALLVGGQTYMHPPPKIVHSAEMHHQRSRGAAAFWKRAARNTAKELMPWEGEENHSSHWQVSGWELEEVFSQVTFCSTSPWSKDQLGKTTTSMWLGDPRSI